MEKIKQKKDINKAVVSNKVSIFVKKHLNI